MKFFDFFSFKNTTFDPPPQKNKKNKKTHSYQLVYISLVPISHETRNSSQWGEVKYNNFDASCYNFSSKGFAKIKLTQK